MLHGHSRFLLGVYNSYALVTFVVEKNFVVLFKKPCSAFDKKEVTLKHLGFVQRSETHTKILLVKKELAQIHLVG